MTIKLGFFIAIAMATTSGAAFAQASDSELTNGSTRILQAISLTKATDLQFGAIVRPSTGTSTVTVAAGSNTRNVTGSAVGVTSSTYPVTRASYNVTGEAGQTFSISVPTSFDMAHSGSAPAITVNLTPEATSGTLTGGAAAFGVGGSFVIGDTTATGAYTGNFTVTVAYN